MTQPPTPLDLAAVADPAATPERIADVMNRADALYEWAKAVRESVRAAVVEHLEATGRPLVIGNTEHRAMHVRETKNRPEQKRRTLHALFDACGGDVDAVADCLYSDPYKAGEAAGRLPPEVFRACFETVERVRLVSGKPRKQLVSRPVEPGRVQR